MIFQLDKDLLAFPDPALAEEDGLLAIGGGLEPERLMLAYNNGIFPWYNEDEPICWYAPHERCVIFPGEAVISNSMQKVLHKNIFEIKVNTAFEDVIENCQQVKRKGGAGTWITEEMKAAYIHLHKLGIAHSIEAWHAGELVGGMYGLSVNKVFCGESMFSIMNNASKAVLIWVCTKSIYTLLDCQLPNPHLFSMGARMIPRDEFLDLLQK
ncbi:MAG: leucyl/phenylalanyl-tRNA--protein transferase [Ferruginibacter sp.]